MRYRREVTLDRPQPWTERDYLNLHGTRIPVELIDGRLRVDQPWTTEHGEITARLWHAMRSPARDAGLRAIGRPVLRLTADRIVIPDLVLGRYPQATLLAEAAGTLLVAAIATPWHNRQQMYADAHIRWHLSIKPTRAPATLRLLRLDNGHYVEQATGEHLSLDDPITLTLHAHDLLAPLRSGES